MENETRQPLVGMVGCDRDLFARVWARVSPEPGEACPIEVLPPKETAPACPVPAVKGAPAATIPVPAFMAGDSMGSDEPEASDVPCLGPAGVDHGTLLQEAIQHELADWRTYQALSARASGMAARTLASMAADERRHAKRLSAAYFLITGIRFLPETPPVKQPRGAFWAALRERFWAEQQGASFYSAAAAETADPCLASLYRELSAEEAAHADMLRCIVEKM